MMAPKSKVSTAKKKADPKEKPKEKEQPARFIEAARELGIDENLNGLDKALEKLAPPKKRFQV